ncbi:MAG: hypothetical protein AAGJ08_00190 [Cyanobacteria bacterium P01_H01_bin.35]
METNNSDPWNFWHSYGKFWDNLSPTSSAAEEQLKRNFAYLDGKRIANRQGF